MNNKKCFNCGHVQEVNEKNIYQDIKGNWTICESCNSTYGIEVIEEID